jgi:hypothetical protein
MIAEPSLAEAKKDPGSLGYARDDKKGGRRGAGPA